MPDIPMDSKEGLMSGLGAFIPVNINEELLLGHSLSRQFVCERVFIIKHRKSAKTRGFKVKVNTCLLLLELS